MKRYILFTDEELVKLIRGEEIEHKNSDGDTLYFMSKEYFSELATCDQARKRKHASTVNVIRNLRFTTCDLCKHHHGPFIAGDGVCETCVRFDKFEVKMRPPHV